MKKFIRTLISTHTLLVLGILNSSGPSLATGFILAGTTAARRNHSSTLLQDGRVIIAGGENSSGRMTSVEVYEPVLGNWTTLSTGLATARSKHSATLLANGNVLFVGGESGTGNTTTETYNPTAGTWSSATLTFSRNNGFTATPLPNGKILFAGGRSGSGTVLNTAHLFDPTAGTWTETGTTMSVYAADHTATLLFDGRVLVAGGLGSTGTLLNAAQLYDPWKNAWTTTSPLTTARTGHAASLLPDGNVLVAGGIVSPNTATTGTEIFASSAECPSWSNGPPMSAARASFTMLSHLGAGGSGGFKQYLRVIGGVQRNGCTTCPSLTASQSYNFATSSWFTTENMSNARAWHAATILRNGSILITGGYDESTGTYVHDAELYDSGKPSSPSWESFYSYTSTTDFTAGTRTNVVLSIGELKHQLATPYSYLNVACSYNGTIQSGTLVRINVNANPPAVVGEYLTAPDTMGRNPSRTTVDGMGNVWVANRDEGSLSGGVVKGSVTRIALVVGGTRYSKNAQGQYYLDATGPYVKNPTYSTAIDRDTDGYIKTSRGLGNILPWSNSGSADSNGGVSTAEDEAIINYLRVTPVQVRTVAVDRWNHVWVGGVNVSALDSGFYAPVYHERIDSTSGAAFANSLVSIQAGGYGGIIDSFGNLWSSQIHGPKDSSTYSVPLGTLRFTPGSCSSPGTGSVVYPTGGDLDENYSFYGIAADPISGAIWQSLTWTHQGNGVAKFDPSGLVEPEYFKTSDPENEVCDPENAVLEPRNQGIVVDGNGHIWVTHSNVSQSNHTVAHLAPDGSLLGVIDLHTSPQVQDGWGPTGLSVDSNGKIWVTCYYSHTAKRINPTGLDPCGRPIGAVDATVTLNTATGSFPYNYSDMTGFHHFAVVRPEGEWTFQPPYTSYPCNWGPFNWNSTTPGDSTITFEARFGLASTDLLNAPWKPVIKGDPKVGFGKYCQVRAKFRRPLASTIQIPKLQDLTINFSEW